MGDTIIIKLSIDKQQSNSLIYSSHCMSSDYPLPGGYGIEDTIDAVKYFILYSIPVLSEKGVEFPDVFLNNPILEFIVED